MNWLSVVSIINLNLQFNAIEKLLPLIIRIRSILKLDISSLNLDKANFVKKYLQGIKENVSCRNGGAE